MNPVIEHAIVAAAVLGAFGYLLGRFIWQRRAGKGCANDCGCSVDGKTLNTRPK
jgi:hypothetical protein